MSSASFSARFLSPKNILRMSVLACLAGMPVTVLVARSKVLDFPESAYRLQELSLLFLGSMLIFVLYYIEYRLAEKITKTNLNLPLGYVQTLGCLAILLGGAASIFLRSPTATRFVDSLPAALRVNELLYLGVFGHAVFLANVTWSYIEEQRPPTHRRKAAAGPSGTWGWPRSAALLFAIAAAFFAVTGVILVVIGVPATQLPMPGSGQMVASGYMWLPMALPFAIFGGLYWMLGHGSRRTFDDSATRTHFFCTTLIALDALRVYLSWAQSTVHPVHASIVAKDFQWTAAFTALATVAFLWNIWKSRNQPAARI